ncbi:MAG: uncharacterized protein H6Q89_1888, partial [Myxococcaceae bacterium]|nr:uncharacterized protein [Myxococcaceae bacterium]
MRYENSHRVGALGLLSASLVLAVLGACAPPPPEPSKPVGRKADPLFGNGGFESGALAPDWTVRRFLNDNGGINNPPWPPATEANLNLTPNAGNAALTHVVTGPNQSQPLNGLVAGPGVPMWPRLGTHSAVINELGNNGNVNSLRQSYTTTNADVDPADGQIHVRFLLAPVLQAAGHIQEDQPYFFVMLRNLTAPRAGDLYSNFNFSNSPGTPWQVQGTGATARLFTDWQIFDVAPGNVALQVGDTVQIEVYAAGCRFTAHWGEVYVDGFGASFPELSIAKTAPPQINLDTDLTYNFLVTNNTGAVAPNVTADEVIPANTTYVSTNAPGATCLNPAVGSTGTTVSCNFGYMNPGASATFSVTVRAYAPLTAGTVTPTFGATRLDDSTQTWAVNAWRGHTVYILTGTGAGQAREIASNTATSITLMAGNNWAPTPDATSTYGVINPPATQGTATTAGCSNTRLDDSTKAAVWLASEWSGWTLTIVAGTGAGQSRNIDSNSTTRLNISPNWTVCPDTTSVYAVKRPPKVTNGNYGIKADSVSRLLGPRVETAIFGGVPFTDLAITKTDGTAAVTWGGATNYTITVVNNGPVAVTNAVVTDAFPARRATAGAATTLTDSSRAWVAGQWLGWSLYLTAGTGIGQVREIAGNTATQLTVSQAWGTNPNATSGYAIIHPPAVTGAGTGSTATTLSDTSQAWAVNQWAGYTVNILTGGTAPQTRTIVSNTAT